MRHTHDIPSPTFFSKGLSHGYEILHFGLIHTLLNAEIRRRISYLSGRTQSVCIDLALSDLLEVLQGVPHGSIIGPSPLTCQIQSSLARSSPLIVQIVELSSLTLRSATQQHQQNFSTHKLGDQFSLLLLIKVMALF